MSNVFFNFFEQGGETVRVQTKPILCVRKLKIVSCSKFMRLACQISQ